MRKKNIIILSFKGITAYIQVAAAAKGAGVGTHQY